MKCVDTVSQEQRAGSSPGETEEEQGQDANHSAQFPQANDKPVPDIVIRQRIKWPPASSKCEWKQFDEDVCRILQSTPKGDVDRRMQALSTITISYASERFGYVEKGKKNQPYNKNRRARKIRELRKELKLLKKQYKLASPEESQPLAELRDILRKKLIAIRRAEWHRRRRRERAKNRTAFIANPFGFAKKLLEDKRNGHLESSKKEIDEYLRDTLSDSDRDKELDIINSLVKPATPSVEFDLREPNWKEVQEVIGAARSASAPGPNGVPYIVYKRCPGLLKELWKILRIIWRRGRVAKQWRYASGVWIPKEENSKSIDQFRTISLLNTESKIFFSVMSRRLTKYLLRNDYIDTSVQKGGIGGMPGCLEHTGVITQLLREAKENKGDLAVLWLDLANAYGSIPHKVVEVALDKYHVPSKISDLILDYYDNFKMSFASGEITSDWHRLERGIITGCTISATLFTLAMNMIVKSAEMECRGPTTRTGVRQPAIRAYMDDLTVSTSPVQGCRWILTGLTKLISWA